jgi:phage baseplate assembly protein W
MYNGFSTIDRSKNFRITDIETVKQDLMNHFSIRRGEKLMNPNFGCAIWDVLFEPFDNNARTVINDEVRRIISYDPRVNATNIVATEYESGIQVQIEIVLLSTNQKDVLVAKFDREAEDLFSRQSDTL